MFCTKKVTQKRGIRYVVITQKVKSTSRRRSRHLICQFLLPESGENRPDVRRRQMFPASFNITHIFTLFTRYGTLKKGETELVATAVFGFSHLPTRACNEFGQQIGIATINM